MLPALYLSAESGESRIVCIEVCEVSERAKSETAKSAREPGSRVVLVEEEEEGFGSLDGVGGCRGGICSEV